MKCLVCNITDRKEPDASLFTFPRQSEKRNKWLKALNISVTLDGIKDPQFAVVIL